MKKLRVTVEGKAYEVLVELLDGGDSAAGFQPAPPANSSSSSAEAPLRPAAGSKPATEPARLEGPGVIPSPLAGKVVALQVKVGETVTAGAQVATLEAMKMNTYINAPQAGRVEAILVAPGDAVNEGAALMRIA